jgi:hypothetical protein
MQPQKPKRIHVIFLVALFAAEAALITLFVTSKSVGAMPLLPELYVAGIMICAILLVFLLLTRLGPVLLLNSAKEKLKALKATSSECAVIEPEGLKEQLVAAVQKNGFTVADTQITHSGGDSLRVTVAASKSFSLFYDRMYKYIIITEDFRKARDFDTLGRYAQNLIDGEGLADDARARSGFATVVVLLMTHVPEQVQAACREEAAIEGPAYVPIACDMTAGKAYYLAGKPMGLLEFRHAQNMIKKYVVGKVKK